VSVDGGVECGSESLDTFRGRESGERRREEREEEREERNRVDASAFDRQCRSRTLACESLGTQSRHFQSLLEIRR
jgi:hypothetical protein